MKKLIITILALAMCIGFTSCGNDLEVTTGIKHTVYENGGSDMISIYMTSDVKPEGVWNYTFEGDVFEIFTENEITEEYGRFNSQKASYKTLALKPITEGNAKIVFELEKSKETKEYILTVAKDENEVLRIKVE